MNTQEFKKLEGNLWDAANQLRQEHIRCQVLSFA